MNEKRNMKVRPCPAGKDSRSCSACSRKNYSDGKVKIFDLVFGSSVIGLCQDCMLQLAQDMADAVAGDGAFRPDAKPDWKSELVIDLLRQDAAPIGSSDHDAQVARLENVLGALPSWDAYTCFVAARSGQLPPPRSRDGAMDESRRTAPGRLDAKDRQENENIAAEYLGVKTRKRYIATGETDLDSCFGKSLIPWLNDHWFLVLADLSYWDDKKILGSPEYAGVTSLIVKQAYDARRALGMLAAHEKERNG